MSLWLVFGKIQAAPWVLYSMIYVLPGSGSQRFLNVDNYIFIQWAADKLCKDGGHISLACLYVSRSCIVLACWIFLTICVELTRGGRNEMAAYFQVNPRETWSTRICLNSCYAWSKVILVSVYFNLANFICYLMAFPFSCYTIACWS